MFIGVIIGLVLVGLIVILFDGPIGKLPEIGDTWKVYMRWSGYGIASEDRKEGGSYFVRVSAVSDSGEVTVETTGGPSKPRTAKWGDIHRIYLTCSHTHYPNRYNGGQSMSHNPKFIGKTDSLPRSISSVRDQRITEMLESGGVASVGSYYKVESYRGWE